MNLILTTTCNKNCSFCFAKDKGNSKLTLENIKEIVSKTPPNESIKLIGGEPTLHDEFGEILDYLLTIPHPVLLISNFLIYKQHVKDAIINFQKKKKMSFLLNVSEMTERQYQVVINNINEIIDKNNLSLSLGFTLDDTREWENDYKLMLERFKKELDVKFIIRTSVPFPNYKEGEEKHFYLYHNYKLIDILVDLIKWANRNDTKVSIDCGLFPCMMKDKETKEFIKNWVQDLNWGCTGGAFDVFATNYASLCYPGKDINVDLSKHKTTETAFNELMLKKRTHYNFDGLPVECQQCEYLHKECAGPCLGFVNI